MHAATDRLEFAPPPTPGLLRALGLAVLAHAFLLAALTWGLHWKREAVSVTVEAELWSAVPQPAAPKPVEVPPELPAETVPPPVPAQAQPMRPDADIALAREKLKKQQELEKQKQEQLLLEKKRLQEKRDQAQKAAQDKKKSEQETQRKEALQAQQDAKKRETMRQDHMKRITGLAGAAGAPGATGTAQQSSGPSAGYAGRIRARIKPNIVYADEIAGNPTAEVEVRTAPDGTIISRKLIKTSGVKSWDDAVLKAIDKTGKLPRDMDGRVPSTLVISFRPRD